MRFWRRRSPGRHALGAAVTGIPSAVPRPVGAAALPVPSPGDELRGGPVFVPSVQLGFRDGTCASLDPSSPHTRALHALARAMVMSD